MILEVVLPRPSIASVVVAARPDVRPAIANALWGPLKRIQHGLEGWRRNTVPVWAWQDGSGRPMVSTTPPVEHPAGPRYEVVEEFLLACASRSETRAGVALAVKLHREAHDAVLTPLAPSERFQWRRALEASACQRPFLRDGSVPRGWRRNHRDPLVTEVVAAVLEQLAVAAVVEEVAGA